MAFGGRELCEENESPIIHACKNPCFQRVAGSPKPSDPNYLHVEKGNSLFLNIIDPPVPLFQPQTFKLAMDFARRHKGQPLTVHCNLGLSRSPVIALMAAIACGELPSMRWIEAAALLEEKRGAAIGLGLNMFMARYWEELLVLPK